jgi:hypothetical protein
MKYFKYNDLAQLGDLKKYSLIELKNKIKSVNYSETEEGEYIYSCWTDKYTTLKVAYKNDNNFVKIVKQRIEIPKWTILINSFIELFRRLK